MNISVLENSSESFLPIDPSKHLEKIREYNTNYSKWQIYRFFGALSGCLAIVPATLSYEYSYYLDRDFDACQIIHENTLWFRLFSLSLSLVAIFLELLYKHYYFRWINLYPLTFEELPPPNIISVIDVMDMVRKRKPSEYISTKNTWLIILLYLVLPYPGLAIQIKVPQQIHYEQVEICYYIEEFFYFVMFFRLFYLVLTVCAYGKFQQPIGRRICELHRVPLSASFSFRCYASTNPIFILAFLLVIPGIIVFGIGIRIFERPLRSQDLDGIENSMWLVLVTMTTVGYGDRVPVSLCARAVVCLAIFWGGISLSLTFVTLGSFLKLKAKEKDAFRSIRANRESGIIVKNFFVDGMAKSGKLKGLTYFSYYMQNFFGSWGIVASPDTLRYHSYNHIRKSFDSSTHLSDKIEKNLRKLRNSFRERRSKTLGLRSFSRISF